LAKDLRLRADPARSCVGVHFALERRALFGHDPAITRVQEGAQSVGERVA
jgi:hypothetical protein